MMSVYISFSCASVIEHHKQNTMKPHFNHNAFSNFNENKLFLYNTKQINIHVAHSS